MTTIRVQVTAEHIAAAGEDRHYWASPVEHALTALSGEQVDVDGDSGEGNIATISQGTWSLVVELPGLANEWLNRRWEGDADDRLGSEPFEFEIEIPTWVEDLIRIR